MKERAISFKPEMVEAILSGQKTQTRRLALGRLQSPYGSGILWVRERFTMVSGSPLYAAGMPEAERRLHRWKPSIHMPRAVCRLRLQVVGTRIERLTAITEADARAEGVGSVAEYRQLWDAIHGSGAPWADDPMVFVVMFRRLG